MADTRARLRPVACRMGVYRCTICGKRHVSSDDFGDCKACNEWVCSDYDEGCAVGCAGCDMLVCSGCAELRVARKWACCGAGGDRRSYHPDCVPDEETEEEHGCHECDKCGETMCPAVEACLNCAVNAEEGAARELEAQQAPLRAQDVRTARDALAEARSESLRALLRGWLDTHAGAAGAAGAAAAKKRKG